MLHDCSAAYLTIIPLIPLNPEILSYIVIPLIPLNPAIFFENLRGIHLFEEDEYAGFNTGFVVYHDDFGDYSTNEPIMDGTANLTYLLAAIAAEGS